MGNELATRGQLVKEMDDTVALVSKITDTQIASFNGAFALAEGIKKMRVVFDHPEIKELVTSLQDSKLGFLTDRSPKAVASAQADGKPLRPYTYAEIKEVLIEGMLKGYRPYMNEINVIAGGFYPTKEGKRRKILETPGLTNFEFTTTSPVYEVEQKTGSGGKTYASTFAKVKCYASWIQNGKPRSIGFSDPSNGKEDSCVLKVKVNAAMGDDAIIGKAISKLFSRVLSRVQGNVYTDDLDTDVNEVSIPALPNVDVPSDETPIQGEEIDVDAEFEKIIPEGQGDKVKAFLAMIVKNKGIDEKAVKTEAIKDAEGFKKAFLAWANPPKKPNGKKPEPQKENSSVTCPRKKNARVLVALCEKCEEQATCIDYCEYQFQKQQGEGAA